MMERTSIPCPYCDKIQELDIYDCTETGDMVGEFSLECCHCKHEFMVDFIYRPCLSTHRINKGY